MKKLLALLLCAPMLCLAAPAMADITKDETVYALLDADGALRQVLVVSHIETPQDDVYVDYGAYTDVSAMTLDVQPKIEGDAITWTLPQNAEGFFSVGDLLQTDDLPFSLRISAALNGTQTEPAHLAGQSGQVVLTLHIAHNEDVSPAYAGYMAQLQVPLSLSCVSSINAGGAAVSLIGRTCTLTYTILPGDDAEYTITFDATDFSMDGLTMACLPMDIGEMLGLSLDADGMTEETATLADGAKELASGSLQLADGLQALSVGTETLAKETVSLIEGTSLLSDGLTLFSETVGGLPSQAGSLTDGLSQASDGMSTYAASVSSAVDATIQLSTALGELSESGEALTSAWTQMQEALAPMLEQLPDAQRALVQSQMAQFAQGLTAYTDGVLTIAEQSGLLSDSISPLKDGGDQLVGGLSQVSAGADMLSGGLQSLAAQTETLPRQGESLHDGAQQIAGGIGTLDGQTNAVAQAARQLSDGQQTFADGVDEALAMLGGLSSLSGTETASHSFASAEHAARSVQFVFQTDAIRLAAQGDAAPTADSPETFWDRLVNVFK